MRRLTRLGHRSADILAKVAAADRVMVSRLLCVIAVGYVSLRMLKIGPSSRFGFLLVCLALHPTTFCAHAQSPLVIYTDGLGNGFQDWSWAARDLR